MKKWLLLLPVILIAVASLSFGKHPSHVNAPLTVISKTLVFPVAGTKNYIKDKWGASRAGGIRRHKGIDIHARKGTPVVAVCDGVIVERAHTAVGGKTLWLKSSKYGWRAYYAHLDQQLVREGQRVRKGQVIGTIGNTGNARYTPSHLHYGIAGSKGWVNPLPYVKHSPKVAAKVTTKKKATTAKRRTRR